MLRYFTGLIVLFCTAHAWAQMDPQQVQLDSLTYAQYINHDWKNLLLTADNAITNKQDFYYLNIRAAVAAIALNKPYKEQYYLQRTYKEYPYDPLALPLLYNNYLTTGQYAQALRIHKQIQTEGSLKEYYPKRPAIHLAATEVGFKRSNDSALYKPLLYAQAGIGFRIKHVSFYNALSLLKQESFYGNMQQYQYYLTAMIPFAHNWTIAPAFHVLHYSINNTLPVPDSSKLSSTPVVAGLSASKQYKNFQYQLGVYYSNLNYENQLQIQPGITWYPFANNTLSLNVTGNYLTEKNAFTTSATTTFTPTRYFSLTGAYLNANTRYYSEQNGFLVNNSYDITGNRFMGMLTISPGVKWSVYAVYLHETKQLSVEGLPNTSYTFDMGVVGLKRFF